MTTRQANFTTIDWSHGFEGNDAHVMSITKNVLRR